MLISLIITAQKFAFGIRIIYLVQFNKNQIACMKKIFFLLVSLLFLYACHDSKKEKNVTSDTTSANVEKKMPATERAPIINITDTLSLKRIVLCMKDSAATQERISLKMAGIFGKLSAAIKKNNAKTTTQPMAWFNTRKAPYFFEAGLPIDKKPGKLSPGMFIKETGGDSVVIAHFFGPYHLMGQAYEALTDWAKERKKKIAGTPYEIYIDDPMNEKGDLKDPYKVQTDIVVPWK